MTSQFHIRILSETKDFFIDFNGKGAEISAKPLILLAGWVNSGHLLLELPKGSAYGLRGVVTNRDHFRN